VSAGLGFRAQRRASAFGRALIAAALFGTGAPACNDRFDFDVPGSSSGAAGTGAEPTAGTASTAGTRATAGSAAGGAASGGNAGSGGGGGAPANPEMCGTLPSCPAPLHCADGTCAQCAGDSDCTTVGLPRCEPMRHRCVACLQAGDCEQDFTCDSLANRCLRKCNDDVACPIDAHGCDESRSVCYECDEDHECSGSQLGELCASDGSGCVECRKETDCPGQHCDQLTGRCVDCRDALDCVSMLCDAAVGSCLSH
jgi:hypothetical protein